MQNTADGSSIGGGAARHACNHVNLPMTSQQHLQIIVTQHCPTVNIGRQSRCISNQEVECQDVTVQGEEHKTL